MMIRKVFWVLFFCLLVFSCFFLFKYFSKRNKFDANCLLHDFKASAIIVTPEKEVECEISKDSEKVLIEITNKKMEGFTFELDNKGKQKISFKGLEQEFDNSNFLNENSYLNVLSNLLKNLDSISFKNIQNTKEEIKFEGKVNGIKFELISDKNGNIKEINIPEKNIKIIFQSYLY
ncbi:MAG: hypothetical protein CfP315_0814 [Candidatus Improbicoccus pseudotrichonymphae]|uniref:Lipoprotein n=1 Tax=Candidatus Improbicoccus pseudotrichonymphae TaxID=3033792 RepID=A0AA48HYS1_9FIRM|nr:MAG: hypothetical protein CfP315_0814 [Candidatus Improbicoccus pseudotrichonymphae]